MLLSFDNSLGLGSFLAARSILPNTTGYMWLEEEIDTAK